MTRQRGQGRYRIGAATLAVAAVLCAGTGTASAAGTAAGARIANTASATFSAGAGSVRIASNTVTLTVDQLVDAAIAAAAASVAAQDSLTAVGFVVSNPGNATEQYALTAALDVDRASVAGIAIDSDGDGAYEAATDAPLDADALTLAAGERRTIFVLVRDVAAAGRAVAVVATIAAKRGHGAPGTVITGRDGTGGDVVVGGSGARASATSVITGVADTPTLWKSQTVVAPDGSTRVTSGAVVTYQIEARFPAPVSGAELIDAIPEGLEFVAGSITLDGRPLTDADGDDAGAFDGAKIRVALGEPAAAGTRTVRFQTRIR